MKASLEGPRGPGCAASALPRAGVWSLGLSPQPRPCPVLPGGEDTWECVRGSLLDPRLPVVLQLSSSVPQKHLGAEWLSLAAVPQKYPSAASGSGMGLPCLQKLGWEVGLGILLRGKRREEKCAAPLCGILSRILMR